MKSFTFATVWSLFAVVGSQIFEAQATKCQDGPALRDSSAGNLWHPQVGDSWQIVLYHPVKINGNANNLSPNVKIWDFDMFDNDASTITAIQSTGRKVICYFSAGSWEAWRSDADRFLASDKGANVNGWHDEKWINTRSANVRKIMANRIALAAKKGCNAVDPDNIDAYNHKENGFKLTQQDSIDYIKFLSTTAAQYGLSIGLKNSVDILPKVIDHVQFGVAEDCSVYSECARYQPLIKAGKPLFQIEYPLGAGSKIAASDFKKICQGTGIQGFSTVIKKENLDGWVEYCDGKTFTTSTTSG